MTPMLVSVVVGAVALLLLFAGMALVVRRFYVRPGPGRALVTYRPQGVAVTFTGALVMPGVHRAAFVDITTKRIDIARTGAKHVVSRDGKKVEIEASFFVGVSPVVEDVQKVANALGERAAQPDVARELFEPKFIEALDVVGAQLTAEQMVHERMQMKDLVIRIIGTDLNGFRLDDVSVTTTRVVE